MYVNGTWNGFDVIFGLSSFTVLKTIGAHLPILVSIYGAYLGLRLWGVYHSGRPLTVILSW